MQVHPAASTSEGRDNDPVDSAVSGLVADRICAARVIKAAEYDRHDSKKNAKPNHNAAAAALFVSPFFYGGIMAQRAEDQ
jgi:hypothetical protein